jgi:L-alanine-DL-glutamate epimerase-like enolase superfamily enzyme
MVLITNVETLRCGAGFRDFCFVKISTDGKNKEGKPIVGWSEYLHERNFGITEMIEWMGQLVIGKDALPWASITTQLRHNTRHIVGGVAAQAIGAIENAVLDIVGKHLDVPCAALFGGPFRKEMPVYWSHCGSFRISFNEMLHNPMTKKQTPPLRSLDDIRKLGEEVKKSRFPALKTNIFLFDENGGPGQMYMPGFGGGDGEHAS